MPWRQFVAPFKRPEDSFYGATGLPPGSFPAALRRPWRISAALDGAPAVAGGRFIDIMPEESGRVTLPPGSSWECFFGPAEFSPHGEPGHRPEFWVILRSVVCSNNRWNSFVQAHGSFIVEKDGAIANRNEEELSVRELLPSDLRYTVILWPPLAKR